MYTFTNVTANHTITASFTAVTSVSDEIIQKGFPYFWNETDNPETGFVRDRVLVNLANRPSDAYYNKASMAATGFGLAALCAAHSDPAVRGTVTQDEIRDRVNLILDKLMYIQDQQQNDPEKWGKDGFFYHFTFIASDNGTGIEAGERWKHYNSYTGKWEYSEVSTIDTAILVAGVLTAGEYFKSTDPDIYSNALQIYSNVNWKAFLDLNQTVPNHHDAANPCYNQLYMAWTPEDAAWDARQNPPAQDNGRRGHWDYTNEGLLGYLLAVAAPNDDDHAIPPETFYAFRRDLGNYGPDGNPMVKSWFGPLFVYQYTQAFFDFKDTGGNALYDKQGVDWWANSVEATKANRAYCNAYEAEFAHEPDLWGLTSGYTGGDAYLTYGSFPAAMDIPSTDVRGAEDGIVFPSAAGGSIPFLPDECGRALARMRDVYDTDWQRGVWGDYGFVSSFGIDTGINDLSFISPYYCGIDTGISLAMAENLKTGLIWDNFSGFQIGGESMKERIKRLIGLSANNTRAITIDDTGALSNFRMGRIDSNHPAYDIKFNLKTKISNAPYLLAVHSFMDASLPGHSVSVKVRVNGNELNEPAIFICDPAGKKQDLLKYIDIDSYMLNEGEGAAGDNTITLEWQDAAGGAKWLAWKNIEISSPVDHGDGFALARNDTDDPKTLFGDEYRNDDTYYAGAAVRTFEQAVNKDTENFTDILFSNAPPATEYAVFSLEALETQEDKTTHAPLDTNIQIFLNGASQPLFDGRIKTGQTITTEGFYLNDGWNRITIYHPGTSQDNTAKGGWVRWNRAILTPASPPQASAPTELGAASFGNDRVKLRWKAVEGASEYRIYRKTSPDGVYDAGIAAVNAPERTFEDTGLDAGTTYYYAVTAVKELTGAESGRSPDAKATTGSYRLDYGDGHDANTFGGNTLGNGGGALGDSAYEAAVRYDGSFGKVRKIALNNNEKNTVELRNAAIDISDARIFSFRIKCDVANADFMIRLTDSDGGEASISLRSNIADLWQSELFYFGSRNPLEGVNLAKIDKLQIMSKTPGRQITIYLDEIDFNISQISGESLNVKIIDGETGLQATAVDFGTATMQNPQVLAKQYLHIDYKADGTYNVQISTDNTAADAYPKFTGKVDPEHPTEYRVNGLVGVKNSGYHVPILWQVMTEPKNYYGPGSAWPEFDTNGALPGQPGWGEESPQDKAEFAFVMDCGDADWTDPDPKKAEYIRSYRTIINSAGILGAPVENYDNDYDEPVCWRYRPRGGPVGGPLYVYLAADFTGAPAQEYRTSNLTVEIWHHD
jgi:hypothetical protein